MNSEKEDYAQVDRIEIEYFTDPLCCWSWAMEPHWRKFINENKYHLNWRYRMVVMIPQWKNYSDPVNDISRPAQMAPLWQQVKYTTHTEIDPDIWLFDPPDTSLLACLAVKSAELQSPAAADILLVTLRKAVMTQKKNIARKEIILELSREVEKVYPDFDRVRFENDFTGRKGVPALKEDIQQTKLNDIVRFPAIMMKNTNQNKALIVLGYKPFPVLEDAFRQLSGVLARG